MTLIVADRVFETTTTTGTGALALAGAVTGFRAFDDVCANNDTCYYSIWAVDGSGNPTGDWETGLGTFTDTDTLTRTTVHASSNSNNAVNFAAGTKYVQLTATATHLTPATATQYRANTADKFLSTDKVWSAAGGVALTPGVNVALDLSSGINFTLAMGGNYTLDNPTNGKAGQCGVIEITQDGTGSRTLAYGTAWKFAGGTDAVLSTAASSKDLLFYQVLADGSSVFANLVKAVA